MATRTSSRQGSAEHAGGPSPPLFSDVLCAVDGTRSSLTAVQQAVSLVGGDGCVTLLAVSATSGSGRYRQAAIDPARVSRVLDLAARVAKESGVQCTRLFDTGGPPSKVILERSAGHDLLAMGAPTMSWLGSLFTGGVTESVLRAFAIPVLLARPAPEEQPFGRRVLVASDAGEGSDRLLEIGASIALNLGGGVMLVHAVGAETDARPREVQRQVHALEAMVDEACEVHVEPGAAHETIVRVALSGQASLIVMGSRRLEGMRVVGSVSERVIHRAPCSVLVVPPEQLAA